MPAFQVLRSTHWVSGQLPIRHSFTHCFPNSSSYGTSFTLLLYPWPLRSTHIKLSSHCVNSAREEASLTGAIRPSPVQAANSTGN